MRRYSIENLNDFHSYARTQADQATLLARTMVVLTAMTGITALTSWMAWGWTPSTPAFVILFLVSLVFVWWASAGIEKDDGGAVLPAICFAALEGFLLGPVLAQYTKVLGPEMVTYALLGTIGITATCGFVSYLFNFAYAKMEGFLMMGLFGLIIFGVGFMFFGRPTPEFDMAYCLIGIVIFIGFFLVDFARLKDESRGGARGWGLAGMLALSIYLDMVNILLYILRALALSKDSKD